MGAFHTDLAFGARGVAEAVRLLWRLAGTRGVQDVQEEVRWQRLGVDLLWDVGGRRVAVEVKRERRFTGNLVLETLANSARRQPGWWITSHAHLVLYGFADTGSWWLLHLPRARRAVRDRAFSRLASVQARTTGSHETSCRLLPLAVGTSLGVVVPA
ncbi:MAG: hypothetical protein H6734_22950, partial [Alphaproteobacteria bacterium]|nr:hypothetical protein [Alphaproteobacteria bacterium]